MLTISLSNPIALTPFFPSPSPSYRLLASCPSSSLGFPLLPQTLAPYRRRRRRRAAPTLSNNPSSSFAELPAAEEEWLKKLPDKKKPLYSHSLPCIEAWLRSLGFYQSREDRAVWVVEKPDWRAQLSLDVTDLYIRINLVDLASFGVKGVRQVVTGSISGLIPGKLEAYLLKRTMLRNGRGVGSKNLERDI